LTVHGPAPSHDPKALRARRKFLKFFPGGFRDDTYLAWERDYKWHAHEQWRAVLSKTKFAALLRQGRHAEIAGHAVRIESRTNLLFSFEKMALRDAVRTPTGARTFSTGLFETTRSGRLRALVRSG
jgi:hypothetical protein